MRRADSEMQQKIEALIQEEADPRERARLLILYQIATVLIDNVSAVRETADEFKDHRVEYVKHIEREEAYLNQGRGMWRIGAVVILAAQAALGYFYSRNVETMRRVEAIVTTQGRDIDGLKTWKQFEDRNGGGIK
jgi:hypothetical protein